MLSERIEAEIATCRRRADALAGQLSASPAPFKVPRFELHGPQPSDLEQQLDHLNAEMAMQPSYTGQMNLLAEHHALVTQVMSRNAPFPAQLAAMDRALALLSHQVQHLASLE
uniref:Uncharacterized protein n=1 Tax=Spironucleus salmonicida TaxID=348837 RepID=V6LDD8_9EUKA|eukprot:EST41671.1 Hypothetical protein SS50377_18759 [Spironucleus salmonicida]